MQELYLNMDQKKGTGKVLQQISKELDSYIEQDDTASLLGGYTGCALFYAYYYNLTGKKKHLDKVHQVILKSVQALSEEEMNLSHCSGVSGIVWCIRHLMKNDFIAQDGLEDIFEEVDDILGKYMEEDLQQGNYDFLHQGLGIALYFLEREGPVAEKYLAAAVAQLESTAVSLPQGTSWVDHFSKTSQDMPERRCFNLGLSHGVPAIISVLGLIYEKGIAVNSISPLLEQGIRWMLSTRNNSADEALSMYPVLVDADNEAVTGKQSRIGWCYGDLGVALALWNTGVRLKNAAWQQEAYDIFKHTLLHRDEQNGSINDACLCHGAAGVAQIYRRLYLATKDPLLLEGAERWLQITLQWGKWKDGLAGFKYYVHPVYENSYGILEGVAGVGLALIAAMDQENLPDWDRCLLIS